VYSSFINIIHNRLLGTSLIKQEKIMPRIRCHYIDCVFIDDGYCSAAAVEIDPDKICVTYSPPEGVVAGEEKWDEDELEEQDEDDIDEDDFFDEDEEEEEAY
jgi:hypothetical protein